MKTQDDVSYEFFLIGVRRIDEIANGTGFYFNIYESISFPVVYFSGGIGFLAGYRSSMLNFYVSSRLDAYFATGLMDDYVGGLLTYTPSIGLAFTKGKQKFFIEASILKGLYEKILKINDKGDSSESSQDIYFVNLGVSF